jgi:hypothetical protein
MMNKELSQNYRITEWDGFSGSDEIIVTNNVEELYYSWIGGYDGSTYKTMKPSLTPGDKEIWNQFVENRRK